MADLTTWPRKEKAKERIEWRLKTRVREGDRLVQNIDFSAFAFCFVALKY